MKESDLKMDDEENFGEDMIEETLDQSGEEYLEQESSHSSKIMDIESHDNTVWQHVDPGTLKKIQNLSEGTSVRLLLNFDLKTVDDLKFLMETEDLVLFLINKGKSRVESTSREGLSQLIVRSMMKANYGRM